MPVLKKATPKKKVAMRAARAKTSMVKKTAHKRKTRATRRRPTLVTSQRGSIKRSSLANGLFKGKSRKRLTLLCFLVLFAGVGAYQVFHSFAATVTLATLEAESITPPSGAEIINDSTASASNAMAFRSNGTATGPVSIPAAATQITVRAKGVQCDGAPTMEVKVDGGQAQVKPVNSGSWADYQIPVSLVAGSHTISIGFTNDFTKYAGNSGNLKCNRDLYVDKITVYGTVADPVSPNSITVSGIGNGATVTGAVPVEAKPIMSGGVSKVEFYLDGALNKTENVSPYCMAGDNNGPPCYGWDSKTVANGSHTIKAIAYDAAVAPSKVEVSVTFNVSNTVVTNPDPGTGTAVDPSGETMPVADLAGWKLKFTDNFQTPVPLGSFPSAAWSSSDARRNTYPGNKWSAYPYPWRDTEGGENSDPTLGGWYNPEKTLSINNGMLDIWMHTELLDGAKKRLVSAAMPRINGPGTGDYVGQLYGRYAVRFRVDTPRTTNNFTGYKTAWLLWPNSNTWPRDGEIDFPEGDLNSTIFGFMHWQGGLSGGDQYYASSGKTYSTWHTAVTEWGPGRNAFYLDGQLITSASSGKSEWFDKVPNTPMRYVLQSETEYHGATPSETTEGHIQVDWIAIWSKI